MKSKSDAKSIIKGTTRFLAKTSMVSYQETIDAGILPKLIQKVEIMIK
jgi:hypothetical protein